MENATVIIRKFNANDLDFIFNSWLENQYYSEPYFTQVPPDVFYAEYAKKITNILANANIDVAALSDDPNTIIAYVVYDNDAFHWFYTKKDYRSQGIMNLLIKGKNINTATSTSKAGRAISKKKGWVFNPFIKE